MSSWLDQGAAAARKRDENRKLVQIAATGVPLLRLALSLFPREQGVEAGSQQEPTAKSSEEQSRLVAAQTMLSSMRRITANQDCAFQRLQTAWVEVSRVQGIDAATAQKRFKNLWISNLRMSPGTKAFKACREEFQIYWDTTVQAWMEDALTQLLQVQEVAALEGESPETSVLKPGPCPLRPQAVEELQAPPVLAFHRCPFPGTVSDGPGAIWRFIQDADPPAKPSQTYQAFAQVYEIAKHHYSEQTPSFHKHRQTWVAFRQACQSSFTSCQRIMVEHDRAKALMGLWSTGGRGRPCTTRISIEREAKQLSWHIKGFCQELEDFEGSSQHVLKRHEDCESTLVMQASVTACQTYLCKLLASLADIFSDLASRYNKATSHFCIARGHGSQQITGHSVAFHCNPHAIRLSMEEAAEEFRRGGRSVRSQHEPLTDAELHRAAWLFLGQPAYRLTDLMLEMFLFRNPRAMAQRGTPPEWTTSRAVFGNLVSSLPVLGLDFTSGTRDPRPEDKLLLVSLYHVHAAQTITDLMCSQQRNFKPFDIAGLSEELPENKEHLLDRDTMVLPKGKPGRRRIEEVYGEELLEFVRSFAMSRGDLVLSDKARVRDHIDALHMPLEALTKAARQAGFLVSSTALSNLFEAPRSDSVNSTRRGVLPIRVGAVRKSEHEHNDRTCYSGNAVKMAKEFLYESAALGINCLQIHQDEKKKVPVGIPASVHRKLGYVHRDVKGDAVVGNPDHDFPLDHSMLLQLSGVVFCQSPPVLEEHSLLKPTFRPSQMHGFVRSLRYNPANSACNAHDLRVALEKVPASKISEVVMLITDNGGDYSMDILLLQFLYGRIWRELGSAMLIVAAYAAGDSSWNWEIEQQWTAVERKLIGQVLGKAAAQQERDAGNLQNSTTKEEALQRITDAATAEYLALLTKCRTGNSPWIVESTSNECPGFPDLAKIQGFCGCDSSKGLEAYADVKEEAIDIFKHLEKSPSRLQYVMCTGPHPCTKCELAISRKRCLLQNPHWTPASALRLLAFNQYRLPYPTPKPNIYVQMRTRVQEGLNCQQGSEPQEESAVPAPAPSTQELSPSSFRIQELVESIDLAVKHEDYLRAQQLKMEKDKVLSDEAAWQNVSRPPVVHTVITHRDDVWACRGPDGQSPFLSWAELRQLAARQTEVFIPVSSASKRERQVWVCEKSGCRYSAKTPTELGRHVLHCHSCSSPAAVSPSLAPAPPMPSTVSVLGKLPRSRPDKKRSLAAPAIERESRALAEHGDVGVASVVGADNQLAPEGGQPVPCAAAPVLSAQRPSRATSVRLQSTHSQWKVNLPPVAKIQCDEHNHRFVVSLDQSKLEPDQQCVDALLPGQIQVSKTFAWEKRVGEGSETCVGLSQQNAYGAALDWVWAKYLVLFPDQQRPADANPSDAAAHTVPLEAPPSQLSDQVPATAALGPQLTLSELLTGSTSSETPFKRRKQTRE